MKNKLKIILLITLLGISNCNLSASEIAPEKTNSQKRKDSKFIETLKKHSKLLGLSAATLTTIILITLGIYNQEKIKAFFSPQKEDDKQKPKSRAELEAEIREQDRLRREKQKQEKLAREVREKELQEQEKKFAEQRAQQIKKDKEEAEKKRTDILKKATQKADQKAQEEKELNEMREQLPILENEYQKLESEREALASRTSTLVYAIQERIKNSENISLLKYELSNLMQQKASINSIRDEINTKINQLKIDILARE